MSDVKALEQFAERTGYFEVNEETVYFLDPVTRDRLDPGTPPPSLLEDSYVGEGLASVVALSSEGVHASLLFGAHGSAQDFARQREYGAPALITGVVGIEAETKVSPSRALTARWRDIRFDGNGARRAYQKAEVSWLHKQGKMALPCDYNFKWRSPLIDKIYDMSIACDKAFKRSCKAPTETNFMIANALLGNFQATREWVMLAGLGSWLKRPGVAARLQESSGRYTFICGSAHQVLRTHLSEYCQTPTEVYNDPRPEEGSHINKSYTQFFIDMVTRCKASYRDLQAADPR